MTTSWQRVATLGVIVGLSGCARVQTRVVELPRVDQEVAGNQGYLAGRGASAAAPRKTTRQVVMTDIELMTGQEVRQGLKGVVQMSATPVKGALGPGGRGWRVAEPSAGPAPAPESAPESALTPPAAPEPSMSPETGEWGGEESDAPSMEPPVSRASPRVETPSAPTTYTVQKNDTLEKIAKKVYGDTKRWPKIYKANRDVIKNPNTLYPGQRLTIPALPGDETESR